MDTLFLVASKTVWLLIRPETLLVALYAMALVFFRLGRTVHGSRFLAVALTITIAIGLFTVGNFPLNPLERTYSAQPVVKQSGLVPFTFRSLNSFIRPFFRMPRGFCRLAMSGGGAGYRTHCYTGRSRLLPDDVCPNGLLKMRCP